MRHSKKHLIWLAALLCGAVHASTPALYLRGGFNGWGTDHALVSKGQSIYETEVQLSPGNHPFKVGSGD